MHNATSAKVIVRIDSKTAKAFDAAVGYGDNVPPPAYGSHLIAMTWLSAPEIKHLVTSACPPQTLPIQTSQSSAMLQHLPMSGVLVLSASATRRGEEIILSYHGEDDASGALLTRGEVAFICVPQAQIAEQLL